MEAPPGGKVNQEFFLMGKEEAVSAIERWLAQAFELQSGSILPRREVYDAYLAWCGDHNVEATAQSAFGKILHRVFPSLQSRRMGGKGRHVMCYQDFARKTPTSPAASTSSSAASLRAASTTTTSNSADTTPTAAAPLGTLRPNRASSPASLGARSNRAQPSRSTTGLASPPQPLSLAETLSRSAPTPLVRKPGQGPGPNTGSRPSSPSDSGSTQQGEQPDDSSPYRWLHSTVASYGSRKRVRSGDGPGAQRGRPELVRRTSQRGGSGATAMKEERGGGDDGEEEQQAEMEEDEREEVTDDAGRDVVDGVHLERLHMKGGAGGAGVKSEKEDEERVQLQKWLEREIEDDIRLLRQSNVPQRQQHQHQHHQHNPSPVLISHLMDHPGMGLGHHLLQDTFGFAAVPGGVTAGGPGLSPGVGELFDMQMMARRAHASHPPPLPPLVPDRPPEGAAWYRSAYSFPMLSFTHASQHPWVVCSFFVSLAFMRQGILGDQVILPLADHFIRLTEYYLEGDLVEAVNQLARARDQISRVFDTTRVEVAWSLLCLTWWNRLLLSDSSGQSRCAYYVALARQMCVQLQLPSGHDVAVSAHLTPLAPAVGLQLGSPLAPAAVISQSPMPLSPQSTPSPSLAPPSFAAASPLGRPISPHPLVMSSSSSSLPPFPQFGVTHPSSRTPSPPPPLASVGPGAASVRQPEDFVNRVSRELYACKTMKEHIDSALPYCKIENDLLQCFIIAFDLVLLHMRGPSASLGSAAVSLTTHLLFLPPSVLSICIFELGLKERILETVLGLLPQYVDGSQVEALYHNLGAMHSLIPVARAMELMRLSVTRSTSN